MFPSKLLFNVILICIQLVQLFQPQESTDPQTLKSRWLQSEIMTENLFWQSKLNPSGFMCVLKFLAENLKYLNSVTIFIGYDLDSSKDADFVLHQLVRVFPSIIIHGNVSTEGLQRSSRNAILLFDNLTNLDDFRVDYTLLCSEKCFHTIFVMSPFETDQQVLDNQVDLVQRLEERNILNSVLFYRVMDDFYMIRSTGFESSVDCRLLPPTPFGKCQLQGENWALFQKPLDLNRCIVHVAYFNNPPFAFTKDNKAVGIEIDILDLVMDKLNVTFVSELVEWDGKNVSDQLLALTEKFDLVFGGLHRKNNELKYSRPYGSVPIVWIIPKRSQVSLKALIKPFHTKVWIAILAIFGVGLVKVWLLPKHISVLELFSLFLGVAWYRQPTRTSLRVQFFLWAFYGFLITQFYLASLAGQLISENGEDIKTFNDLVNSDMKLGGDYSLRAHFDSLLTVNSTVTNSRVHQMINKCTIFESEDYVRLVNDLITGVTKEYALAVRLNSSWERPKLNQRVYVLDENFATITMSFLIRDKVPFFEDFDNFMINVSAYGLIDYLSERYTNPDWDVAYEDERRQKINIVHLVPGFLFLSIGFSFAILTFLAELLYGR